MSSSRTSIWGDSRSDLSTTSRWATASRVAESRSPSWAMSILTRRARLSRSALQGHEPDFQDRVADLGTAAELERSAKARMNRTP